MESNGNKRIDPIYILALLGPRALQVIERHTGVPAIMAHDRTLRPAVASFGQANAELTELVFNSQELVAAREARMEALRVALRHCNAHLQHDLPDLDVSEVAITETKAAEVMFYAASNLIAMLTGREDQVPAAEQVRGMLESSLSSAQAAFEAVAASRVAIQEKQHALRALAADVHRGLVQLRSTLRAVLGRNHLDYQRLLLGRGRIASELPAEVTTDATSPPESEPGSSSVS